MALIAEDDFPLVFFVLQNQLVSFLVHDDHQELLLYGTLSWSTGSIHTVLSVMRTQCRLYAWEGLGWSILGTFCPLKIMSFHLGIILHFQSHLPFFCGWVFPFFTNYDDSQNGGLVFGGFTLSFVGMLSFYGQNCAVSFA